MAFKIAFLSVERRGGGKERERGLGKKIYISLVTRMIKEIQKANEKIQTTLFTDLTEFKLFVLQ